MILDHNSPLLINSAAETRLALATSLSPVNMVFLTKEYCVPGISMKQEKMVWSGRLVDTVASTDTSYIIPLLTVVVLVSLGTSSPCSSL